MQRILIEKLHSYIIHNNPDMILSLQADCSLTQYLEQKVKSILPLLEGLLADGKSQYVIEEICLDELTKDLRPSKFNYIRSLLEEEFEQSFYGMKESGTLTYEIVNLIISCKPVFELYGFTKENEDSRDLHYAISGTIKEYLEAR